jgi:ATP-dependent RNA helicase DDX56/DBP9
VLRGRAAQYIHRAGRTARGQGNVGCVLSIVCAADGGESVRRAAEAVGKQVELRPYEFKQVVRARPAHSRARCCSSCCSCCCCSWLRARRSRARMSAIEQFRYRVVDAVRSVTGAVVREARLREIRRELVTSDKLKAYFEDNPRDLAGLRHDTR